MTLASILDEPTLRIKFKDHLKREYSLENLIFYQLTLKLRATQNEEERGKRANYLLQTFIYEGASLQVNVSGEARDTAVNAWRQRRDVAGILSIGEDVYRLMENGTVSMSVLHLVPNSIRITDSLPRMLRSNTLA